jgi:large subunit ribosomal protein L13
MKPTNTPIYKIDATGKSLGRLASDITMHLRDKHLPTYEPHKPGKTIVKVENVEKMVVTGKKLEQKLIYRHTRYPGGLKKVAWKDLYENHPEKLLEHSVYGMLPKNQLREEAMKRLIIKKS